MYGMAREAPTAILEATLRVIDADMMIKVKEPLPSEYRYLHRSTSPSAWCTTA